MIDAGYSHSICL